jgi:hypothetical protein
MLNTRQIKRRLAPAFTDEQAEILADVVTDAYDELVKTSDFNELKAIVKELAEAQRELVAAQQRTEQQIRELVIAQQGTQEDVRRLRAEHDDTRRQVGGLSTVVGYTLEDEAYLALPQLQLLRRDYGLTLREELKRGYVTDSKGNALEINIIGRATTKEINEIFIIGESKSQLSKNEVDRFIRRKLDRLAGVYPDIFPLLVTYQITAPDVETYARDKGIALYYSYDFKRSQ